LLLAWNGFRGVAVHLGGMEVAGVWKWVGRIKDPIVVGDWQRGEPRYAHENCLTHWQDHKWHDIICSHTHIFLTACEYSA